jgi:hypothetical protein
MGGCSGGRTATTRRTAHAPSGRGCMHPRDGEVGTGAYSSRTIATIPTATISARSGPGARRRP